VTDEKPSDPGYSEYRLSSEDENTKLGAELETEKKLHGIAEAFHDLAVTDRDLVDVKLALVDVKLAKAIARVEKAEREIAFHANDLAKRDLAASQQAKEIKTLRAAVEKAGGDEI